MARSGVLPGAGTLVWALLAIVAAAWLLVIRDAASMAMPMTMAMPMPGPGSSPSMAEAGAFAIQWGVMMAAMMLPSAAPMFLLYRTVSNRLSQDGDRAIPVGVFVAVYLLLWLLTGLPVYGGYVAVAALRARWTSLEGAMPYAVATVLVGAGIYQFTELKRVCLRNCESPLAFLMRRWRSGYSATLRLAVDHAGYCIGCCWALMIILVAAGAMSIGWVVAIALVVSAEKLLPRGWRTARIVGIGLIALGLLVALRPVLAETFTTRL